jgi:hypothetical protein
VAVDIMGDWADVQFELGLLERETPPAVNLGDLDRTTARRRLVEIGRDDPCWCGSGRK